MLKVVLVGVGVIMVFLFAVHDRRATGGHIVMITLASVIAAPVIVVDPCFFESFPSPSLKVWLKGGNGGLNVWKLILKEPMYVSGPIRWDWVNVLQGNRYGFYELVGGRPESIHSMDTNQQQATKEAHKSSDKSGERNVDQCLWLLAGICPGIIFLIDALLHIPFWQGLRRRPSLLEGLLCFLMHMQSTVAAEFLWLHQDLLLKVVLFHQAAPLHLSHRDDFVNGFFIISTTSAVNTSASFRNK